MMGDSRAGNGTRREFVAYHRMLFLALALVLLFHGSLLLSGSYQRTYDAFVHIFMADHYRRDWFSSWDQRWYTGFTTMGYPPGSHQTIAALSPLIGLRAGFVAAQIFALVNLTIGVYRWAHLWVDHRAAGWSAVLLVVSSSIAETVHVFGQLPTTFSLGFLLNSLPFAHRWVRDGSVRNLFCGIACTMATTAGHHVTTLFGAVFFAGPVLAMALLDRLRSPLPGEPPGHPPRLARDAVWPLFARRLRRVFRPLLRTCLYGFLVGLALVIVVLPYWLWSRSDPITQVSIPHASRENFLVNRAAGLVFWLVPWGTGVVALPYALVRGFASPAWPLAACLGGLAFLGTGGTTPFPRMLLGGAFDILTLDRFTFWATITILPLSGQFVVSVISGTIRRWLVANLGRFLAAGVPMLFATYHLVFTLFCTNLTHYRPFQPTTIDYVPIVGFLEKDDHWRWRYLMLGFGDQMAWVSANTTAATVDGNYHSARRLPELTSRPVERLEGAKFTGMPGIGSLQQFLAVPSRYSLKYVFCNDEFYNPLLHFSGWHELGRLENGIMVWERADVPPLPAMNLDRQAPAWQRYCWGIIPPTSLLAALVILLWALLGAPLPARMVRGWQWVGRRLPTAAALRAIDARLAASAARIPLADHPADRRWLPWRPLVRVVRGHAARAVSRARRRVQQLVVVVALVAVAGGVLSTVRSRPLGPADVVTAYYEHLDFRRFDQAYALLDPRTRPDFTQYRLDLSRDGGLVASFAKLDSVTVTVVERVPDRAEVEASLDYLTSLDAYHVDSGFTVRRVDGTWAIDLPPASAVQPPEQFTNRPEPRFLSQGKRVVTSAATSTADILDRPELSLADVRSLRVAGRWIVVGEVTNVDVDPADVTVNAQLRDSGGTLLGSWDAAQVMNHKLMPGESSPFRVEFQSVAGTASGGEAGTTGEAAPGPAATPSGRDSRGPMEFDPRVITPLTLPEGAEVASVGVYARAVVTPLETSRGLQVDSLRVETSGDRSHLVGVMRNDGVTEASVPHLLLSYLDSSGAVGWVDHAYLEHSVAPQRTTTFRIPLLVDAETIEPSGVPTAGYTGVSEDSAAPGVRPTVALPAGTGFSSVSVFWSAYSRAGQ